ncbi:MAG: CAP domain-containing protein [Syntrophorhabdaceae bacterium]|nr:CAP domain-containing protein [Syntrophorhabdaceae bacterium]MDD4197726.1 CAP domain-containing protein [Syntrophorhabdaceae bacterium]
MANSSKGWYYMGYEWRGRSIVYGPFTAEEIRDAFKKGDIDEKTQVRYGLNSPWLPLKDVAFFSRLVSRPRLTFDKQEFLKRHKTWVLIIAIVLFTFVYSRLHTPHHAPVTSALSTSVPYQEVLDQNTIINLTNKARALNGLSHLNENPLLNTIAEKRAEDMFEKQYFDHVSPFGEKASDIAQRVGYRYKTIGENIASGRFVTNQKVIDGWMQSPGHRKNILSTDVEDLGAAIIKGNMHGEETCIAVQIFGLQSREVYKPVCLAPSQTLFKEIEVRKAELGDLKDRLAKLKQELDNENASIEADRSLPSRSPSDTKNLNLRIRVYNEKSNLHNGYLADMKAKSVVLQSMIGEYNEMVQTYNSCKTSQ